MPRSIMGVGCVALIASLPAAPEIIYDNGAADFTEFIPASWEEQQLADDFVLLPGANVVADIHWWGGYLGTDDENFTIRIYADDSGPDGSPLFEILNPAVSRTPLGGVFFEYSLDIDPINLSPNTTYWLSIYNDASGWGWATTGVSGNEHFFRPGIGWTEDLRELTLAFQLTGPNVIPEPASLALLGFALAGFAHRLRRPTR